MDAVAARPDLELHGLVVLRDGGTVLEHHWAPYLADDLALVYSVSKTFTATAVGLAIAEGHFGLDTPVVELLGETSRIGAITVHHLLSMSTGHTNDTLEALDGVPPADWVRTLLAVEPPQPVGSCHVYNNGASFLLAEIVRRATGQDLLDYLRPRLLDPLGIDATWDRDDLGRCLGWTGLHLTTRGLAAMGELYRNDGVWRGRRLLPEGWVARATIAQIPTTHDSPDWRYGYGYQLWLGREGYRLDGAYGQFAFVLPERGMVVAIQSAQSATQDLIDLLWDHLDTLETVPADASVPVPPDSGLGTEWHAPGPVPADAQLADPGEELGPPADIADVRVCRDGNDVVITLSAEGDAAELATRAGEWRRQSLYLGAVEVPVALAAGADEAGNLQLRIVFTDTPHTLRVRIGIDGSSGQAWKVNPLQGPSLAHMRAR